MARYLTQHTLACLTRQGAENLAQRMHSGGTARAERVLVRTLNRPRAERVWMCCIRVIYSPPHELTG